MRNDMTNIVINKTGDLVLASINFIERVYNLNRFKLSNQLYAFSISSGANDSEPKNVESKIDFIIKMKIASTETYETDYWLRLCSSSVYVPPICKLSQDILETNKISTKIISSSKNIKTIVN